MINIPMLGEVRAAGLSPVEMEKEVLDAYGSQLVNKQVTVVLEAGQYPVFVSGAVLRPGKIISNRPLTALEAIMEAGGFNYARANTKAVRVIRQDGDQVRRFTLNLQRVLNGESQAPFYIHASDIIYVPEKFSWF
jgi:polysaccharide biosynthesis/export protein